MTPYLLDPKKNDFVGDDLKGIKKEMKMVSLGVYEYRHANRICTIIVSDEKYPGLVGPESLIEYLS